MKYILLIYGDEKAWESMTREGRRLCRSGARAVDAAPPAEAHYNHIVYHSRLRRAARWQS